jgi:uncharacterized membrane protein (UPF0127 family)
LSRRLVVIGLATAGAALIVGGSALVLRDDDAPPVTATSSLDRLGSVAVTIEPASGPARPTCMLAARTEAERARGLMEVTDPGLDGHDGMVFVYAEDASGAFWMRNTPMPLSIAYVDAGGRLVSSSDMEPCRDSPDCPSYPAAGPYRYAVEVPRGRLDDLGITASARLRVGGSCS